ncbi:MAG: hypothetical protein Kow0042_05240 [Calditrichia bacterium]
MKLYNKPRLFLQLVIVALVVITVIQANDPEAYCPLGGILSIGSRYINEASSCQMGENQMFLGIGLLVGILVIGKLFCSYVCPIGTVTEWLGRLGRKFKIQVKRLPAVLDRGMRVLKYLLLLPVLYYTVNSSELFCKTFDPYFAATTGFGSDVVFWWAMAALIVTILGSVFIRQFWCKYLCPLGALSNIFMNVSLGVSALVIYVALRLFGVEISIFWLFLVWLVGGFAIELISRKNYLTPLIKISRNQESCTNCKICDRACPYDIEVSKLETVNSLDCTMCADCVDSCPVPETLVIRKPRWKYLPVFATIFIAVLSLGFASRYELSTLSERWIPEDDPRQLAVYETEIKSVKCYGSANSLLRRVKPREGIYGMDAYAKSHRVKIYYDPAEIEISGVKKALFSPYKSKVCLFSPENDPELLEVAYFGVMNINDNIDNANMIRALRQSEYIYGLETYFGEPVRVLIYYDPKNIQPEEIVKIIEVNKITYKVRGEEHTAELNFEVKAGPRVLGQISQDVFLGHIFKDFHQKFNQFGSYDPAQLKVFEIGMPDAENFMKRRYLPYFVSHISQNDGIVGFETRYSDRPIALVYYDPLQIDTTEIQSLLSSAKMTVSFSNGEIKEYDNPFTFTSPSAVKTVAEVEAEKEMLQKKLKYLAEFQD